MIFSVVLFLFSTFTLCTMFTVCRWLWVCVCLNVISAYCYLPAIYVHCREYMCQLCFGECVYWFCDDTKWHNSRTDALTHSQPAQHLLQSRHHLHSNAFLSDSHTYKWHEKLMGSNRIFDGDWQNWLLAQNEESETFHQRPANEQKKKQNQCNNEVMYQFIISFCEMRAAARYVFFISMNSPLILVAINIFEYGEYIYIGFWRHFQLSALQLMTTKTSKCAVGLCVHTQ